MQQRRIAWNVIWNTAGTLTGLLSGFVVAPFLVHHLGNTVYGLWLLIASLTGYFSVLDLGISGSVGRNLAFYRARDDRRGVNTILSTAAALLLGVAALAMGLTFPVVLVFPRLVTDIPPEQLNATLTAIVLVGLNLALAFPLGIFDGILWAWERFDWQNFIDIPATLLRLGLTTWLVSRGHGLVALAWITLGVTLLQGMTKAVVCFRLDPELRFRWSLVNLEMGKELYGYGIWFFLLSLSRTLTPQVPPLVVGKYLGAGLVPAYRTAAQQLVSYANTFMITGTQVLTPVATAMHAQEDRARQQQMCLLGGRTCLTLSLAIFGGFFFLGQPFLVRWLGPGFAGSWLYLIILAGGEIVPMSQWISYSLILGMARHRGLALLGFTEAVATLTLALALIGPLGLTGAALAAAAPAFLCRGLGPMLYVCWVLGVPVGTYLLRAILPAIGLAAPFAAFLWVLTACYRPSTWLEIVLEAAAAGGVFLATAGLALVGPERLLRFRSVSPVPAPAANPTNSQA